VLPPTRSIGLNSRLSTVRLVGWVLVVLVLLAVWLVRSWLPSHVPPVPEVGRLSPTPVEAPKRVVVRVIRAHIQGHVYDTSSTPVSQATVSLRPLSANRTEERLDSSQRTPDAKGFFSFPVDRTGTYVVSVSAEGFAPDEKSVEIDEERDKIVDFRMERLTKVAGRIVAQGNVDTANLRVVYRANMGSAVLGTLDLDTSGAFSKELPPGQYTFAVCRSVEQFQDQLSPVGVVMFAVRRGQPGSSNLLPTDRLIREYPLILRESQAIDDLVFVLPNRHNRVEGRVVTAMGDPVEMARLFLADPHGNFGGDAVSDAQGMFSINYIPLSEDAGGLYLGISATPNPLDVYPSPLEVTLGQTDVLLVVQRQSRIDSYTIKGRVIDRRTGKGIANAAISSGGGRESVYSTVDGTFEVESAPLADRENILEYNIKADGYADTYFVVSVDLRNPPQEPAVIYLDRVNSLLTIRFTLPRNVSSSEVLLLSAELTPPDSDQEPQSGSAKASIPLMDWTYGGEPENAAPASFETTKEVPSGDYELFVSGTYTHMLNTDEKNLAGDSTRIVYRDAFFDTMSVAPGENEHTVQLGGNAVLSILLPSMSAKAVRGKIWHAPKKTEGKTPIGSLHDNNGCTDFSSEGSIDPTKPLSVPGLPGGSFFAEVTITPQTGDDIEIECPVELRDGMTTTLTTQ